MKHQAPASETKRQAQIAVGSGASDRAGHLVLRRFLRHKPAVVSLVVLVGLMLASAFAPFIARHDPYEVTYTEITKPPSASYIMGTDTAGRDVFSRLLHGGRVSLSVGLVAVGIYITIGVVLGSIAGYYGGQVDAFIMRCTDVVMSFPVLIIIITFVAALGPSIYNAMLVIGLLGWPGVARLVRGQFLSLRKQEFVEAARSIGVGDGRLVFRHILPNVIAPLVVTATLGVADAILLEAALSFLGLGVQPPMSSWGNMLNQARSLTVLESMPWLWIPPGVLISTTVLCINFLGDGLRDALDPRMVLQ